MRLGRYRGLRDAPSAVACTATATMCCEPASCPEGESCTLNNTWGCSREDNNITTCENGETCVQSQSQCWVLGGAHYDTFDGQVFEFQGNCTYTLIQKKTNDASENNALWVGVQKDRTFNQASSFKAIHVKVAKDNIYRAEEGSVWPPRVLRHSLPCHLRGPIQVNPLPPCPVWKPACVTRGSSWMATPACPCPSVAAVTTATITAATRPTGLTRDAPYTDPNTHQIRCHSDSCGSDECCGLEGGVRSCVHDLKQTCVYTSQHVITFDRCDYDFRGTCQYQLLGVCGQNQGLDAIWVQTDAESALHVLVNVSGVIVKLNSENTENIEVNGVKRNMPCHFSPSALAFSLHLHTYIYTDTGFEFSLSTDGIIDLNGTQQHLSPELFGKLWRSGQNPLACVEGCLGGSCPECSSADLARFSDPEACRKILEVNGPFRHCHGKVDPSSFYKRCVSDLCLHGGLQPALCHSLADYTAVCFSRKAPVYAWRSPGFCYPSCPSSTSYNTSSASVGLCLGWQNNTSRVASKHRERTASVNQVNGVYENLPFSQNNITVHEKNNGWISIKVPRSTEPMSDLRNPILVKISDIYHQTTCGLCGNYNDDPLR
ncbi:IgGFc-binding protein-like [Stegastes partitus]|uniref:IgGFc-binding protein-like n=1 Tax=Stegastes partitus TaxID=144197 RepID=A0A9Y4NL12_9TELE|nr:PREDICTED: IgGFc-binding protein-like [Stegastes partitus]